MDRIDPLLADSRSNSTKDALNWSVTMRRASLAIKTDPFCGRIMGVTSAFQTSNLNIDRSDRIRHGNRVYPSFDRGEHNVVFSQNELKLEENTMLGWALTFLVIALIAAALGFGGLAGTAAMVAKVLFVVFLVLFILGLVMGRRGPTV